jgi:DNA-binding CsgD family transcriptional regulator
MTASAAELLGRIERIPTADVDSRQLRLRILDEVRRSVPFDAHVWPLTDPETTVGTAPVADVPCLPELPDLIRRKYLSAENRWTLLRDVSSVRLAPVTAGRERWGWGAFLLGHDFRFVASVVFRDRYGTWGWLDLWRGDVLGPFTPLEVERLRAVAPLVTALLRRTQAETFAPRPGAASDRRTGGPLVLLLSADLEVQQATPRTHEYLRVMVPPEHGREPVPANALNVAAQLLAVEAGVDLHPPTARVHLSAGLWVTVRAARLGGEEPTGRRSIAVTIEECSSEERLDVFARSHGLSERESELLGHLVAGADTREVAARMFVSPHTVQDHLKSVFVKTGTHSRRELLARILGH